MTAADDKWVPFATRWVNDPRKGLDATLVVTQSRIPGTDTVPSPVSIPVRVIRLPGSRSRLPGAQVTEGEERMFMDGRAEPDTSMQLVVNARVYTISGVEAYHTGEQTAGYMLTVQGGSV